MLGGMAIGALVHAQTTGSSLFPTLSPCAPTEAEEHRALSYFRKVEDDGLQLSSFLASRAAEDTAAYRLYLGLGYTQDLTSFARFSGRTFYGTGTYDGSGTAVPDEVRSATDPGAWLGSNWQVESKLFDKHSFFAGVDYRQQMTMPLTELSEMFARTDNVGIGQPARKVGFVTRSRFVLSSEYAINVRTRFDEGTGLLDTNRMEVGMERSIRDGSRTQLTYSRQTSLDSLTGNARIDQRLTRFRLDVPTFSTRISTGFELQYLNVLDPLEPVQNRDFVIGNLSIAGHDFSNRTRVSLGLNNEFDVKDDSAEAARLRSSFPVDGRTLRIVVVRKL